LRVDRARNVTQITQREPCTVASYSLVTAGAWLQAAGTKSPSSPSRFSEVTVTRMHVNEAVYEALFASPLQPSDTLTAETVADAIGSTVRRLGAAGCTDNVAEEFGNHPDEAAERMRWIRRLTSDLCACLYLPVAAPVSAPAAGTDLLPVCEAA